MELNYSTIIKYLNPESVKEENKVDDNGLCKKNIIGDLKCISSNITNILKESNKKFYRIGVSNKINMNNKDMNISFFSSILTVLDKNFLTYDETLSINILKSLIGSIKEIISKSSFKFELKYKFPKTVLLERVSKFDFNDGLIYQVFVQILDINLLIFDKSNIYTSFPEDSMNPWKPIIMMNKNNDSYEPILSEDNKLFSYNDSYIRKIFTKNYSEIKYFNEEYLNKEFSLNDDILQLIDEFLLENNETCEDKIEHDNDNIKSESVDSVEEEEDKMELSESNTKSLETKGLIKKSKNEESELNNNKQESLEDNNKIYNKTSLRSLKKDELLNLISKNKKIKNYFAKSFDKSQQSSLTKSELIEKFIFFQNMLQNQNSVQSSSS